MKWLILVSRTGRFEVQNGSFRKKKTRKRIFRVNFSVKKEESFFWKEKKSIHDFNVIFSYTFTLLHYSERQNQPKTPPYPILFRTASSPRAGTEQSDFVQK